MNLSELCIRRPVMTVLLSVSLIIAGVIAYNNLPIAALPSYDAPTIVVKAELPGASPETMASAVATQLERELSAISGLSVISSASILGESSVTLEFNQNHPMDRASIDVQAALLRVQPLLPAEMTLPPSYSKINPAEAPIIHLALTSPTMPLADLNEFAENLISPAISALPGLAQVQINGQKKYVIRIRVNSAALAARNLTIDDLADVLSTANANSPVGTLDGSRQTLIIQANRQLNNAEAFAGLIVAAPQGSAPVRLSDVAQVEDSVESIKSTIWINGERAITLAVQREPGTNTVAAVDAIKMLMPGLNAQMPSSVQLKLLSDRSISVRDAIHDIEVTLILTIMLVVLVVFVFLRKPSAILIPTLSLTISLLGAVVFMQLFGYTLNNISLLAITLAVGLVVDDAIVVLENIVRHIENGAPPLQAALQGSKEVSFTIISISVSLVAVFIPVFFMPGVIGLLFHEFAAVVGIAVLTSALVSLTLVPVMASRYLAEPVERNEKNAKWQKWFERGFVRISEIYECALDWALLHKRIILGIALSTLIATIVLFTILPKGFFPNEDTGQAIITVEAVEDISFPAMVTLLQQAEKVIRIHPAVEILSINVTDSNNARMFVTFKPRNERPHIEEIAEKLRRDVGAIPGIRVFISPVQNLRLGARTSKSRYQYVLRSVHSDNLHNAADKLISHMLKEQHIFRDVTSDIQLKGLQVRLNIDRDKANLLGVQMADIRSVLYSAFGERQVSTIYTSSNSYKVIMQVIAEDQMDESAFDKIHLRGKNGTLIPLSTVVFAEREVGPVAINHTGQLESVTISFNLAPGVALGDASMRIAELKQDLNIPESVLASYAGDAAAFESSQMSQIVLIIMAIFVIYVLLGVLYESYIHPITILSGLPSAAAGALAILWLFNIELSIIAMIGILLLIGIVKKNAIMMIDFALDAQRSMHIKPIEAIRSACLLRFRPIMMTTVAALMGALPIAFGLGAGAELRQPLGLTVVGGLLFSQVITLFITPVIYLYLDDKFKSRIGRHELNK